MCGQDQPDEPTAAAERRGAPSGATASIEPIEGSIAPLDACGVSPPLAATSASPATPATDAAHAEGAEAKRAAQDLGPSSDTPPLHVGAGAPEVSALADYPSTF